jgi:O-antigen/teichoic acid export membrane protein
MRLSLVCGVGAGVLVGALAAAGVHPFVGSSAVFCLAIAAGTTLNGVYQAGYYWLNRQGRYGLLARSRVIGAAAVALVSFGAATAGALETGLVLGSVAGLAVNCGSFLVALRTSSGRPWPPVFRNLGLVARRYGRFPKYLVPAGLLDRTSSQLHVFLLASFFGRETAGALGLYQRAVGIPSTVVGRAMGDVFKQRAAAELAVKQECETLFWKTARALAMVAVPASAALIGLGPWMFATIFGEEWRLAGEFARIMALSFGIGFVVSPLSALIHIGRRPELDLILQGGLIVAGTAALLFGRAMGSAKLGLAAFAGVYCVKYTVEFLISRSIAGTHLRQAGGEQR